MHQGDGREGYEAQRVLTEIRRLEAIAGVRTGISAEDEILTTGGEGSSVAVDERGFHLVYWERGAKSVVHTEATLDELLFGLFVEATRRVDIPGVEHSDYQRRAFPKQLELLGRISPAWAERGARAQREELEREPFDDEKLFRLALRNKLLAQGASAAEADRAADERYPRPSAKG